jgi:anti-sigma B factor antagonist
MATRKKKAAAGTKLAGDWSIYRAAELQAALQAALAQAGDTLELDLSGVTELDTAGVQLLMTAKRQAQAQSRSLRLFGHSAAVLDVFDLLNLGPYFGDPLLMARPAGKGETA